MPRFQQCDSAQLAQRDRTCFSSSSAMLLETIKPGTLKGPNGDDQYLAVVQHLVVGDGKRQTSGDTTDASAQPRALAHYGVTARLVQSADFQLIEQQIARGIPVPCGYIHRGPVDRPTGSGHWLIVVGHTPTQVVVNDPWGEPDLIGGTTLNPNGMGLRFSRLNYRSAGLRLRQALDGGADRWRCLPLCARQGLGGGGGQHPLRRSLRTAFSAAVGAGG
ncbi:MAG: C39 family peptidase [Cyanobium sp.]